MVVLLFVDSNIYIVECVYYCMVVKKKKNFNLDDAYLALENNKILDSIDIISRISDEISRDDILSFYDKFNRHCDSEIEELRIEIEEFSKIPSSGNEVADSCSVFAKEDLKKLQDAQDKIKELLGLNAKV